MIRLHCTKKLLAKLPLHKNGRLISKRPSQYAANDEPESPLGSWHANLLLIQRRQCVLFVHDATRFPVFVPTLKKADLANLDYWFEDGFMNTLLKTGADDELMDHAHAALGPLLCDSACDRSVQGTLNQMAQDIGFYFAHEGVSVAELTGYRLSAWLANRPCGFGKPRRFVWPVSAMHDLLASASQAR